MPYRMTSPKKRRIVRCIEVALARWSDPEIAAMQDDFKAMMHIYSPNGFMRWS